MWYFSMEGQYYRNLDVYALRGLRSREGLTQKQLAEMIGARPTHISEMENGKRPIGKGMAKRLAKVLRTEHKIFL